MAFQLARTDSLQDLQTPPMTPQHQRYNDFQSCPPAPRPVKRTVCLNVPLMDCTNLPLLPNFDRLGVDSDDIEQPMRTVSLESFKEPSNENVQNGHLLSIPSVQEDGVNESRDDEQVEVLFPKVLQDKLLNLAPRRSFVLGSRNSFNASCA